MHISYICASGTGASSRPQFLVPELASGGQTRDPQQPLLPCRFFVWMFISYGSALLLTAGIAQRGVCAATACATLLTGRPKAALSAAGCSCCFSLSLADVSEQHRAVSWAGHGPVPRTSLQLLPAPLHLHSPAPHPGLQATPRLEAARGSHWPNYNVKPQFPHV